MRICWRIFGLLTALVVLLCSGCSNSPGRPVAESIPVDPDNISDFNILYGSNCAGCHGQDGKGGAAVSLGDPVYLAIADDAVLKHAATSGIPGTAMPAFAKSAGGMLTEKQIDLIVQGIHERWSKPELLRDANPPTYAAAQPGDSARGFEVYASFCASCHGPAGRGGNASSIVDGSFLALVSNQYLRTLVIVGRPELGAPDWRGDLPGKPLSSQDISDVVAWLSSQRAKYPGQPYPHAVQPTGELK
jgi:cytochrome c oxidase cbb3-type subunit III